MSTERSQSRGRDVQYQSTGRGGAGNFKRSESVSRDRVQREVDGDERGREILNHPSAPTHSGRGGAGNVRSPSRDPAVRAAEIEAIQHEKDVIEATRDLEKTHLHSSGRGGFGNMTLTPGQSPSRPESTSRSRSREPGLVSSGRGGAGNIRSPSRDTRNGDLAKLDEEERKVHAHKDGIHSTGRGGWANITHKDTPHEPHNTNLSPDEHHGHGRGGLGNIHQAQLFDSNDKRDPSKERGRPTERQENPHPHVPGIVEGLWNKVSGKE